MGRKGVKTRGGYVANLWAGGSGEGGRGIGGENLNVSPQSDTNVASR